MNCSTTYVWEDEDNLRVLTFDIEGTAVPYTPAKTYGPPEDCYPAEGGYVEDLEIKLVDAEFSDENGNTIKTFKDLTPEEIKQIEIDFENALDHDKALYEHVEEGLGEDYDRRQEPDPDALYEKWLDKKN